MDDRRPLRRIARFQIAFGPASLAIVLLLHPPADAGEVLRRATAAMVLSAIGVWLLYRTRSGRP